MHRGYLPIWRKFFDEHPFWQEKREFSKAEAWLDILQHTQYERVPKRRIVHGKVVMQNYGEAIMSTRYCADRWGWHNSRVFRFFNLLKKMEQIETKTEHKVNKIIVLNFDTYDIRQNAERNTDEAETERKQNANRTQTERTKESKESTLDLSKDKSAHRPHDPVDPPHEQKAPSGPPAGGPSPKKKNHFTQKIPKLNLAGIEAACLKLEKLSSMNGKKFNPWMFVQQQANLRGHPQAILDSLTGLISLWDDVKDPWPYTRKIMMTKNGNYNEQEHIKQAEEFKSFVSTSKDIKALLADIGNRPGKGGT